MPDDTPALPDARTNALPATSCCGRSNIISSDGACPTRPKYLVGSEYACGNHVASVLNRLRPGQSTVVSKLHKDGSGGPR